MIKIEIDAEVYDALKRLAYVLPLEEIADRVRAAGWSREDLEVNIDHANGRWKELNWTLERYLRRF